MGLVFLALGICGWGLADTVSVPQLVNYQGMLTDAEGSPYETAEYTLVFSIFGEASAGEAVWGPQTFADVPVVRGHFNVLLGPVDDAATALDTAFASPASYLEITVAGETIAPRQQILSAPYAMRAEQAAQAEVAATLSEGALTTPMISEQAVTPSKLAPLNYVKSLSCETYDAMHGDFRDVTNLSVTIATNGRPVRVGLEGGYFYLRHKFGGARLEIRIMKGDTVVKHTQCWEDTSGYIPQRCYIPADMWAIDDNDGAPEGLPADTYTYRVSVMSYHSGESSPRAAEIRDVRLVAYEM